MCPRGSALRRRSIPRRQATAPPRRTRRVTQAEIIRAKRRRRLLGALGVLAVLAVGAFVSINLLFKVTIFRVESYDGSQPVDTGIYTSDELIEALGIEKNSNLFAFSTAEKTQQLALQFPYLERVAVEIQLPAAVIIKVEPATERFACMYPGGWMVLSDSLKILRTDVSQPDGLILLTMSLPTDFSPMVGQNIEPKSYNSLLSETQQATAETAGLQASALQTLTEMRDGLQENNLFDGTTALNIQDLSDIEFTYQNRVQVLLGSETNLAYKLRLAVLFIPGKGDTFSSALCHLRHHVLNFDTVFHIQPISLQRRAHFHHGRVHKKKRNAQRTKHLVPAVCSVFKEDGSSFAASSAGEMRWIVIQA